MTGRDRLFSNVLSGWISHTIVIATGLVIPRLINDMHGVAALGIWDFAWSTVRYLAFTNLGVAAATGRYVALYRASDDVAALSTSISTILVWQTIFSLSLLAVISCGVFAMPSILAPALLPEIETIQWVVGCLALGLVFQIAFAPARGVLSGHHRWGLNNAINGMGEIMTVVGMIAVLVLGGGLRELALVHLASLVITELVRATAAASLLSDIKFHVLSANWAAAREIVFFGAKSTLISLPTLIVVQTTNILLAGAAGPAVLAIFARPLSLLTQISMLVNKYSSVLTTMASGIVGLGRSSELAQMFLRSAKTALLISGPMLAVLAVDGDVILRLWMGDQYSSEIVPLILASGMILPSAMSAATTILAGRNSHGKLSLISIACSITGYVIAWRLVVGEHGWSPETAAIVVCIGLTSGPGLAVLLVTCRELSVSVRIVFVKALLPPLLVILAISFLLWIPRYLEVVGGLYDVAMGMFLAFMFYVWFLWRNVFSEEQQKSILRKVDSVWRRVRKSAP